jgi:pyruvate carboxylase
MTDKFNERAAADILRAPAFQRLFVYGTLLSSAVGAYGQAARSRLAKEAPHRVAAHACGQLYELGQYPGLVASASQADLVHGQLMLLADQQATLSWLDEYEAISTVPSADNEYVRKLCEVTIAGGLTVSAWTYVYVKSVTNLTRIHDGRWRANPYQRLTG